jgi:hypothetical protein
MRPRCTFGVVLAALLIECVACSGANPSSGQTAYLRIQGAQFVAGAIDISSHGQSSSAPLVATLSNELFPGVSGKSISGSVGPGSTAVMLGLQGDSGYWVLPVQDPDPNTAGNLTFSCTASFSPLTPSGDAGHLNLVARATNRSGEIGEARLVPVVMDTPQPSGALVISLEWDTQADLDLHLVLPAGDAGTTEIWSRKPSALPAGQAGATVDDGMAAGYLDVDSNSQCVLDGRRAENVIFPTTAPAGHYVVRVDTFSLCGETTARWHVHVVTPGSSPLDAYGQSTDTDLRFSHGQGAGVQALAFDYAGS